VCAEERRELSLPAAAGGLKTMGYGRMATHRPGGVLPGGHSPSVRDIKFGVYQRIRLSQKFGHLLRTYACPPFAHACNTQNALFA
jgi:hypothetical protein